MLSKSLYSNTTMINNNSHILPSDQLSQRQILLGLLYLVQGLQKYPFWYLDGKGYQMNQKVETSQVSHNCLKEGLFNILSCANIIRDIINKNQILGSSVNARVKTFSHSVNNYLHQSNVFYSNLLTQLQKEAGNIYCTVTTTQPLTIMRLHVIVQQKLPLLSIILKVINHSLTSTTNQGVLIINMITDLIDELYLDPIKQIATFYELITPILHHQLLIIKEWLMLGQPDFFIKEPIKNEKISQADMFFNQPNPIYISALPNLFRPSASTLLQIGKTIRYILLFFNQSDRYSLIQYFQVDKLFDQVLMICPVRKKEQFHKVYKQPLTINQKLTKNRSKHLMNITIDRDNPYQMFPTTVNAFYFNKLHSNPKQPSSTSTPQDYQPTNNLNIEIQRLMKEMLSQLNEKCLNIFNGNVTMVDTSKIRRELSNTLKGIKQFMLYAQGDFFQELMVMIYDTMERPMNMISNNLVNSFIEEAKKSSNAKELSEDILQNVTFFYLNTPEKAQYLKGWHNFSILYKPTHPTNYIFITKFMECFGHIFNFIFQLKKCQFTIKNIWADYKSICNHLLTIRNQLHLIINTLMTHIMIQIDVQWVYYQQQIHSSHTISQIIENTRKTISNLRKITIDQKYLVSSVESLMEIVDRVRKLYLKQQPITKQQMDKLKCEVKSICQLIMKVEYYKEVLDFNEYYSKMMN